MGTSEEVAGSWAQLQNVLKRRADLIPAVEAVAEAHSEHERALFTSLARSLSDMPDPARHGPSAAGVSRFRERESALVQARAAIDGNPRLRSSAAWESLRREVVGSENRIAIERRRYNEAVRRHRVRLRSFPARLVAPLFGFTDSPEY